MGKKGMYIFYRVMLSFVVIFALYAFALASDDPKLRAKYKGYNVILVIMDSLRPDHLGCYGYAKNVSPHIDALAGSGVVFRNAYSQSSLTMPSTASIFTSLHPYSHRMMHIFKDSMPPQVYTLAQILNIYGYETIWFGWKDDPHSGSAPGLLNGFKKRQQLSLRRVPPVLKNRFLIPGFIRKNRQHHFFITVHCYGTHMTIFSRAQFKNKFTPVEAESFDIGNTVRRIRWAGLQDLLRDEPGRIYDAVGKRGLIKCAQYLRYPYSNKNYDKLMESMGSTRQQFALNRLMLTFSQKKVDDYMQNNTHAINGLLDSCLFELDNQLIGTMTKALQVNGLGSKTIIVVTADHGDEYGEHGKFAHGPELYDESIHVPLIMYIPGWLSRGRLNDEPVQSIDIFPTILDLLGIAIPAQAQGKSLIGFLEAEDGPPPPVHKYVYSQSITGLASIRSKQWKLIVPRPFGDSGVLQRRELYDLRNDPTEKNNLIEKYPDKARELEEALDDKLRSLPNYQGGVNAFSPAIDKDTQEQIRKTGYW